MRVDLKYLLLYNYFFKYLFLDNYFMNIQHVISLLQSKAKLTQAEIASEIGCSQSNISTCKRVSTRPSNKLVSGLHGLLIKYDLKDASN